MHILTTPWEVDDGIPSEADIEQAVRGLKWGRAGLTSGIRAEDLKGLLQKTSRENNLVRRRWQLLVRLIQSTFGDMVVPEVVTWVTMVFLLKGREVSGDRDCGGSMEGLCGGGKFSAQEERNYA